MILAQALGPALAKGPNNCAIEFLGKNTSYRDLSAAIARLSYLFQKEIGVGQRVAFLGSNSPAFIPAFFALSNNRSLTIPIDPALSDMELAEWVRDTQPSHVLVTTDTLSRVRDLFRRQNLSLPIIELEKKRAGEYDATFVAPPEHQPNEKDAILLLRTAGTAGRYKYTLFNHIQVQGPLIGLRKLYRYSAGERVLTTMSWSHPFAFVHAMLFPILSGAACLVDRGQRGEEFLKFLGEVRPTRLVDTPDFLQKLAVLCGQFNLPLKGVKSATVGTGKLGAEARTLLARMQVKPLSCYGITEGLWTLAMGDFEAESNEMRGLVGYRYKVINRDGDEEEGSSREGQLCVQAPAVMLRYVLRDEDEAKKLMQETIRGTWLYTGDYFRLEESDGNEPKLTFLGRKDGLNPRPKVADAFNPALVEAIALAQEGVAEVVVLQEGLSETSPVVLAVVRKPEASVTEFELLDRIRGMVTPRNAPQSVIFLEAIPRQGSQVDRDKLKELLEAKRKNPKNAA